MKITVYGISTCGTVKKARAWLDAAGVAHGWVDFRATPVEPERVRAWVRAFGVAAMRNTSGASFRALGPEREGWSEDEWAAAYIRDPMLIKRPVVEREGEPFTIGFREEAFAGLRG